MKEENLLNHFFIRRKKQLFIFVILFFISKISVAQFPINTSYQTIPTGSLPALPPLLDTVIDNTVPDPITITRITEYNVNWDWYPIHDYSKIQPWNADASIYKFSSVAIYDANTHQMIRTLPNNLYPSYWSNTNADIMYSFREDGEIKTYSISNNSFQTLYQLQGYEVVKLGPGEGNIDNNDHYVALVGKNGINLDVIVFNLQTNQIVNTETFTGAWGNGNNVPDYIDWISVSQSGNYVGIMWNHNTTSINNPFNGHYGVEIYTTSNMQFLRRIADYGNHGDFGYAVDGDEVFVQFWGPTGSLNMYYLNRMERIELSNHSDFTGEGHVSCRNLNRPGWAYVSQDEEVHSGQLIAIKLDNSGLVEHFGHHFSSSSTYNKSPMPVPSPNGDKLMFKSDFGNAANALEVFSFEAKKANSLAINDFKNINLIVSPNPANNRVYIENNELITEIRIYNTIGQQLQTILNLNSNKIEVYIQNLIEGIYFIKIIDVKNKITVKKIVKSIK